METKKKIHKEMIVSARRLLQYFQLPDKNFREVSKYINNSLQHFKTCMYLLQYSRATRKDVLGTLFLKQIQKIYTNTFLARGDHSASTLYEKGNALHYSICKALGIEITEKSHTHTHTRTQASM
jgi:hypothetical protein